jgi:hypothetical protein
MSNHSPLFGHWQVDWQDGSTCPLNTGHGIDGPLLPAPTIASSGELLSISAMACTSG